MPAGAVPLRRRRRHHRRLHRGRDGPQAAGAGLDGRGTSSAPTAAASSACWSDGATRPPGTAGAVAMAAAVAATRAARTGASSGCSWLGSLTIDGIGWRPRRGFPRCRKVPVPTIRQAGRPPESPARAEVTVTPRCGRTGAARAAVRNFRSHASPTAAARRRRQIRHRGCRIFTSPSRGRRRPSGARTARARAPPGGPRCAINDRLMARPPLAAGRGGRDPEPDDDRVHLLRRAGRHRAVARRPLPRRAHRRAFRRFLPGDLERTRSRDDRPRPCRSRPLHGGGVCRRDGAAPAPGAGQGQPRQPRQSRSAPPLARDPAVRRRLAFSAARVGRAPARRFAARPAGRFRRRRSPATSRAPSARPLPERSATLAR